MPRPHPLNRTALLRVTQISGKQILADEAVVIGAYPPIMILVYRTAVILCYAVGKFTANNMPGQLRSIKQESLINSLCSCGLAMCTSAYYICELYAVYVCGLVQTANLY